MSEHHGRSQGAKPRGLCPPSPAHVAGWLSRLFFGRVPVEVARSLKREPEAWSADTERNPYLSLNYQLEHRSGLTLWIANSAYGQQVVPPGGVCYGPGHWGGVTVLSSIGLSPGHWLLWAAARRWARERRSHSILNALAQSGEGGQSPRAATE